MEVAWPSSVPGSPLKLAGEYSKHQLHNPSPGRAMWSSVVTPQVEARVSSPVKSQAIQMTGNLGWMMGVGLSAAAL